MAKKPNALAQESTTAVDASPYIEKHVIMDKFEEVLDSVCKRVEEIRSKTSKTKDADILKWLEKIEGSMEEIGVLISNFPKVITDVGEFGDSCKKIERIVKDVKRVRLTPHTTIKQLKSEIDISYKGILEIVNTALQSKNRATTFNPLDYVDPDKTVKEQVKAAGKGIAEMQLAKIDKNDPSNFGMNALKVHHFKNAHEARNIFVDDLFNKMPDYPSEKWFKQYIELEMRQYERHKNQCAKCISKLPYKKKVFDAFTKGYEDYELAIDVILQNSHNPRSEEEISFFSEETIYKDEVAKIILDALSAAQLHITLPKKFKSGRHKAVFPPSILRDGSSVAVIAKYFVALIGKVNTKMQEYLNSIESIDVYNHIFLGELIDVVRKVVIAEVDSSTATLKLLNFGSSFKLKDEFEHVLSQAYESLISLYENRKGVSVSRVDELEESADEENQENPAENEVQSEESAIAQETPNEELGEEIVDDVVEKMVSPEVVEEDIKEEEPVPSVVEEAVQENAESLDYQAGDAQLLIQSLKEQLELLDVRNKEALALVEQLTTEKCQLAEERNKLESMSKERAEKIESIRLLYTWLIAESVSVQKQAEEVETMRSRVEERHQKNIEEHGALEDHLLEIMEKEERVKVATAALKNLEDRKAELDKREQTLLEMQAEYDDQIEELEQKRNELEEEKEALEIERQEMESNNSLQLFAEDNDEDEDSEQQDFDGDNTEESDEADQPQASDTELLRQCSSLTEEIMQLVNDLDRKRDYIHDLYAGIILVKQQRKGMNVENVARLAERDSKYTMSEMIENSEQFIRLYRKKGNALAILNDCISTWKQKNGGIEQGSDMANIEMLYKNISTDLVMEFEGEFMTDIDFMALFMEAIEKVKDLQIKI